MYTSVIFVNTRINGGFFMKKYTFYLTGIFFLYFMLFSFFCWQNTNRTVENLSHKLLRFHVIANSDSDFDQNQKLKLKSYLVETLRPYMTEFTNSNDAINWVSNHLPFIQNLSENFLHQPIEVCCTTSYFPIKTYGNYTFPPGNYPALQVKIGKSLGKNWWCVMYPSLCFTDEKTASFSKESEKKLRDSLSSTEYEDIRTPLVFRWKIAEIINNLNF